MEKQSRKKFGILEFYCGSSGKAGFYNNQEIGLSRGMKALGYDCYVFYPDIRSKHLHELHIEKNITVVYVPAFHCGVHGKYNWNILKRYNIEIAQINIDNQVFAPRAIKYCEKHDIKCYCYVGTVKSDTNKKLKQLVMHLLEKRNINAIKRHYCFTKTTNLSLELKKYRVNDLSVLPVGLDTSIIPEIAEDKYSLRKKLNLPNNDVVLLFVGRIDEYKRPLEFARFVANLPQNYSGIMIGSGAMNEKLQQFIVKYKLCNRIRWIKQLDNKEIHAYYKTADYFINLNDHEIFGMSILEAMYQGCTVIAAHAPGPDEIIEDKKNGFLVSKVDEINAIVLLHKNIVPEIAKNTVLNNFNWNKNARVIVERLKCD